MAKDHYDFDSMNQEEMKDLLNKGAAKDQKRREQCNAAVKTYREKKKKKLEEEKLQLASGLRQTEDIKQEIRGRQLSIKSLEGEILGISNICKALARQNPNFSIGPLEENVPIESTSSNIQEPGIQKQDISTNFRIDFMF